MKRAVIYLRVSTSKQVGKDVDPEGYSIPAQREACYRKAEQLNSEVVAEYIDAGESAKTVDRPQFQRMLERINGELDIDYIIIDKLDRFARNRRDDANTLFEIRLAGAELISVKENIDETPTGGLVHGILATVAEFESRNGAVRTMSGMTQKAKVGGTPGRAPIGYLNVRESVNGREVRVVILDPERAPHIRWAFEAYASGEWTAQEIAAELERRGLRSRPSGKQPAKPLHLSRVAHLLSNRYYLGFVNFRGVEYRGRHEPLIDDETFDKVQQVLQSRQTAAEKPRVHHHYLKGTVFCLGCEARLCITVAKRRYFYLFCSGRHRRSGCRQPFLPLQEVEDKLVEYYRRVELDSELADAARTALHHELRGRRDSSRREVASQRKRLARLEDERRKLLQAHYAGAIPLDLLKEEQGRITRESRDADQRLHAAEEVSALTEEAIDLALTVASNLYQAYLSASSQVRRLLNQVFFVKVLVGTKDVQVQFTEPVQALYAYTLKQRVAREARPKYVRLARDLEPLLVGPGLNDDRLVRVTRLKLVTSSLARKRSIN